MALIDQSCNDFTVLLASKRPVPSGGGACAMVGAVGIALGNMVGAITVGKEQYAEVEKELSSAMERAEQLRLELLACVDADAAAFEPLSRAYAIPRDDPRRAAVMEECLRTAAAVPVKIFDLCCEAIELQREFAEKGSELVLSDAATGALFCRGAMDGAAVNIKVNTGAMTDRAYAEALNAHVEAKLEKYRRMAEHVYEDVCGTFR